MLPKGGFTGLIPLNEVAPQALPWIDTFDSGRPNLDQFLRDTAKDQHADHLSQSSLIFHDQFEGLVGYITMANDCVPLTPFETGELGLRNLYDLRYFPAVKICRLAVHQELKRQGIGRFIIELAIGQIIGSQTPSAARLLITDAVNEPEVLAFYKGMGFFDSGWADEQAKKAQQQQKGGKGSPPGQRATVKMLRDLYG